MSTKGFVGVIYRGQLRVSACCLFYTEGITPEEIHIDAQKMYGKSVMLKYVECEDVEEVFEKVSDKCKDFHDCGNIYSTNASTMLDHIKTESKVTRARTFSTK